MAECLPYKRRPLCWSCIENVGQLLLMNYLRSISISVGEHTLTVTPSSPVNRRNSRIIPRRLYLAYFVNARFGTPTRRCMAPCRTTFWLMAPLGGADIVSNMTSYCHWGRGCTWIPDSCRKRGWGPSGNDWSNEFMQTRRTKAIVCCITAYDQIRSEQCIASSVRSKPRLSAAVAINLILRTQCMTFSIGGAPHRWAERRLHCCGGTRCGCSQTVSIPGRHRSRSWSHLSSAVGARQQPACWIFIAHEQLLQRSLALWGKLIYTAPRIKELNFVISDSRVKRQRWASYHIE